MKPVPTHLYPLLPDTATISSDGILSIAGHALSALAQQYATPLYLFDRATIIQACHSYREAFSTHYTASDVHIVYAAKAYLSPLLARMIAEQGMGLDVVSGGELMVAQAAAFPMERVSFHGNNKTEDELLLALRLGVGRIVLDNWHELERLTRLAKQLHIRPKVLLRIAPGIVTDTHVYLQTGHAAAKFGFPLANGEAKMALLQIIREHQLQLMGLHAHCGTMLQETRPFEECLQRLLKLAFDIHAETNWWPEEISPGGGWAVATPDAMDVSHVSALAIALHHTMVHTMTTCDKALPTPRLIIEPGRSIIARAGMAVYRVGARKVTPGGVTYLFVDGGMADNIRPALYGAHYLALAIEQMTIPAQETVCIAGRYCESGDILIERAPMPVLQEGDLLALPMTGAYCLPMASNYNLVPRPAVILLDEQQIHLMERRETYDDLLKRYPLMGT